MRLSRRLTNIKLTTMRKSSRDAFRGLPSLGKENRGPSVERRSANAAVNRLASSYMAIFPVGGSKSITLQNSRISSRVPSETRMYLLIGDMTGASKIL
jgi:hypothetical protein